MGPVGAFLDPMLKQVRHLSSPLWRSRDIKLGQRRKRQCLAAKKRQGGERFHCNFLTSPGYSTRCLFLPSKTPGNLLISTVLGFVYANLFLSMDGSAFWDQRGMETLGCWLIASLGAPAKFLLHTIARWGFGPPTKEMSFCGS